MQSGVRIAGILLGATSRLRYGKLQPSNQTWLWGRTFFQDPGDQLARELVARWTAEPHALQPVQAREPSTHGWRTLVGCKPWSRIACQARRFRKACLALAVRVTLATLSFECNAHSAQVGKGSAQRSSKSREPSRYARHRAYSVQLINKLQSTKSEIRWAVQTAHAHGRMHRCVSSAGAFGF